MVSIQLCMNVGKHYVESKILKKIGACFFVLKNTENLFGSDWLQKFNLWDQPINTFCQKVECITAKLKKLRWN